MRGRNDARDIHDCDCVSLHRSGNHVFRDFSSLRIHFRAAYCMRPLCATMEHVNNKFERKTKTGCRFPRTRNFLSSEQKAGRIFGTESRTTKCLPERERENFNHALFALHFSPGDKIQNCPAQFLAICCIVHVQFKVHRLRHGFSVSNALLLNQSARLSRKTLTHRQTMMAGRRWERSFLRIFGTWNLQFRNRQCDPYRRIKGACSAYNSPARK
jgi:hypothetical protein